MKKLYFLLFAVFFVGCSNKNYVLFQKQNNQNIQQSKKAEPIVQKEVYEYKIKPQDRLNIVIFNNLQLSSFNTKNITNQTNSQIVFVYPDGTINLPLIGRVKVSGLTEQQATEKLTKLYAKYIKNPYIKVEVINKKVYVLGEVKKPGVIKVNGDYLTLIEAISECGGLLDDAKRNEIKIISGSKSNPHIKTVDLTKISAADINKLILKPNDIVYVTPMKLKPLDVKIKALQPIAGFINTILGTIVDVKVLSK